MVADKDNGAQKVQSLGSGFVIDAEQGIVVTNNHVIADADDIEVNFSDGITLKATLVGTDTKTMSRVLKVDPKGHKLTAVKFGDSTKMRVGDWVMAIGNPFGLGGTVTSASSRPATATSIPARMTISSRPMPRSTAAIPVVRCSTARRGHRHQHRDHFTVRRLDRHRLLHSSQLASGVVDQLRQFGETRRGWLGVRIQPVTDDIAESLGMATAKGALVAGVIKGGPVDNGTIQAGDVILKFDGKDIHEMRDLPRVVAESPVGKAVDVLIVRKASSRR